MTCISVAADLAAGSATDQAQDAAFNTGVLLSPNFLFRIERDDAGSPGSDGIRALNSYELASRLSYFLWSSMPDDELFRLAEAGKLTNPEALRDQVRRVIKNSKSDVLAENFAGQWLELRKLPALLPDPKQFPEYDVDLSLALEKETVLFFNAILRENRPITDFIDGRYTFINERLAKYYGIPNVVGPQFRRVPLDGVERSGVLTQGSILAITSYPNRTSPMLRGLWVLENILALLLHHLRRTFRHWKRSKSRRICR